MQHVSEAAGALGVLHISVGILVIAVAVPFLLGRVPMNRWFGTRLPASYASEANWYSMNRYGALQLVWYGAALIVLGIAALLVPPRLAGVWFVAMLAAPAVLAVPMLVMVLRFAKRLPK